MWFSSFLSGFLILKKPGATPFGLRRRRAVFGPGRRARQPRCPE
jgi:hypothetical protein